jgi:hypothetical protein
MIFGLFIPFQFRRLPTQHSVQADTRTLKSDISTSQARQTPPLIILSFQIFWSSALPRNQSGRSWTIWLESNSKANLTGRKEGKENASQR